MLFITTVVHKVHMLIEKNWWAAGRGNIFRLKNGVHSPLQVLQVQQHSSCAPNAARSPNTRFCTLLVTQNAFLHTGTTVLGADLNMELHGSVQTEYI